MKHKKIMIGALAAALMTVCVISGILLSSRHAFGPKSEPQTQPETQLAVEVQPLGTNSSLPAAVRAAKLFVPQGSESPQNTMQTLVNTGFNTVLLRNRPDKPSFSAGDKTDDLALWVGAAHGAGLHAAVDVSNGEAAAIAAFAQRCGADAVILSGIFESVRTMDLTALQHTVSSLEDALAQNVPILWDIPFDAPKNAGNAGFTAAFAKALHESGRTGIYTYSDTADESYADAAEQWITFAAGSPLWFSLTDAYTPAQSGFMRAENAFRQCSALLKLGTSKQPVSFVFSRYESWADDTECARITAECIKGGIVPESLLKTFKITNYNSTSISTTESKITFIGECNPAYPLTCNGASVPVTADGFFSAEYALQIGKNTFTFANQGKTFVYTVQYTLDLLRSISPSGSLSTPGGGTLEVSVVAHRGASVSASLGGTGITMTSTGVLVYNVDNGGMDASSDYVTFTGQYRIPESQSSSVCIGTLQANASYQGYTDSISGARVTVTAAQQVEALPVVETPNPSAVSAESTATTAAPTTTTTTTTTTDGAQTASETDDASESESGDPAAKSTKTTAVISTQTTTAPPTSASQSSATTASLKLDPVITPYTNHGLPGTKRMCRIKTYYTETMPLSPLNDLSVPLTTPLPIGTFDFITGESSFDTYTYYNLGSGRRVYRKDVEVIEKAYAMPANTLTVVSSGTGSGKTDIRLHLKWKVPFNAVLNGQSYINDPKNRREYAVTSLNAKSLDITFYYTAQAVGQPNVSASGVISSAEWLKSDSAQTCTLRLYLRNASRFYGYSIGYNADDTLQLSVKEKGADSVSGKTVMLDPGHGGADGGASCAVNSGMYNEAKIALSIAEKVRSKLQSMGAAVMMTRTSNTHISLDDRKRMARQNNPDVFVSIHLDAAASSSGSGTTAFYYRPYSYALAKSIHTQLVNTYVQNIYGTQRSSIDRGTIFFPYSVTRIEECPSVLIECGFVSNMEECRILQNSQHQDSIATTIANGIRDYFASN